MANQPLTVWRCDECGEESVTVDNGYVIWRADRDSFLDHGFRIVHQVQCDPGSGEYTNSIALSDFLGAEGVARLLALVHPGALKDPKFGQPTGVAYIGEWVDFFRRVQTPYYEAARQHFTDEATRQWLGDGNEIAPYVPETLERIANGYRDS